MLDDDEYSTYDIEDTPLLIAIGLLGLSERDAAIFVDTSPAQLAEIAEANGEEATVVLRKLRPLLQRRMALHVALDQYLRVRLSQLDASVLTRGRDATKT